MTEHEQDIAFLVERQRAAGSCDFTSDRWTGMSSNSLVCVAYGGPQEHMPYDRGDYAACVRTVRRLPRHRRTAAVMAALRKARDHYLDRYPSHRSSLARSEERAKWEREREEKRKRSEAYYARKQRKAASDRRQHAN